MDFKKSLAVAIAALTVSSVATADTVDIAIMYTAPAAQHTGDISAKIDNYISYANNSYRRNGVDIQLRLVDSWRATSSDLRVNEDTLDLVTFHRTVNNWRASENADMVVMLGKAEKQVIGGSTYITCGIAWVGQGANGRMYASARDRAYSVTGVDCGYNTFVHELGHNMGLTHSTKQGDTTGGVYSYGLGHGVDNRFSTIMAYPWRYGANVTQYDWFSDPDWNECGGLPCGERRNGMDISNAYRALGPIVDDIASYY
ncbi:reprolysin-like metallopeptidase [Microbulbifer sp. 2205BS26-8]|uniref:reprolysin-like metallopeptidase n=1 Tax=Microbulbifer sp. 2205BS26-8 TaxID=3064386 RepID=UPI00273E4FA4|nr:zinc-dependent metalloprotease family protein [Microbulbifer sp. 2205BS26-8]MDP5209011.1 zinc-dependent metalloprotease family protein [Microbulbifer sp. 2205BS26-8]